MAKLGHEGIVGKGYPLSTGKRSGEGLCHPRNLKKNCITINVASREWGVKSGKGGVSSFQEIRGLEGRYEFI